MGSVLTPLIVGLDKAYHLPNACTLNGRCEEMCPMSIPLPSMLRKLRTRGFERGPRQPDLASRARRVGVPRAAARPLPPPDRDGDGGDGVARAAARRLPPAAARGGLDGSARSPRTGGRDVPSRVAPAGFREMTVQAAAACLRAPEPGRPPGSRGGRVPCEANAHPWEPDPMSVGSGGASVGRAGASPRRGPGRGTPRPGRAGRGPDGGNRGANRCPRRYTSARPSKATWSSGSRRRWSWSPRRSFRCEESKGCPVPSRTTWKSRGSTRRSW